MRCLAVLLFGLSSAALASGPKQLAMPVGHTTTVSMGAPVSSVKVADPSLVSVRREGRRVVFVARSAGRTEAVVKTVDGETHLQIYVAADKYGMP